MKKLIILCLIALLLTPSTSMALTVHEKFHLDGILEEQKRDKEDPAMMEKLASSKGKTMDEYLIYLDEIKVEVNKILTSGIFPNINRPSDIADYLEK